MCYASGMLDLSTIPAIDGHLHPPLATESAARESFATFFTEADDPDILVRHLPTGRFFARAVRDLAALYGCEPHIEEIAAVHQRLGVRETLRRCTAAGNVAALIVDDGYAGGAEALAVAEMEAASSVPARRVVRLESVAAALATGHNDIATFEATLFDVLDKARAQGAVALKSIVAYRCGLAPVFPTREEAAAGLRAERARLATPPPRLTDPRLLYFVLERALEWAGEHALPVQIHTGFGDRDLDLARANPALLRPLLEEPRFARCPIVLLHAGYPYSREAAYLAAMYAHVYVDWSLANPLLAGPVLVQVLHELLALAPASKLLYGSDAWGIPDWIYLGARYGREALAAVLADDHDAPALARHILHDNAAALYGLPAANG